MLQVVWKMGKVVHLWDKCVRLPSRLPRQQQSRGSDAIGQFRFCRFCYFVDPGIQQRYFVLISCSWTSFPDLGYTHLGQI